MCQMWCDRHELTTLAREQAKAEEEVDKRWNLSVLQVACQKRRNQCMRADCSALSRLLKKGARWQWEDAHQKVEASQQRLAAHHREALGLLFGLKSFR